MTELSYRDEGQGEVVLLVHGLGASSAVFDRVIAAGAGRRRFLAVDLPRSGRSGAWAHSSPESIATGLASWLDGQGVDKVHVFGHSFGGLVAAEFAARWPHRVSSLVMASAPALGVPPEVKLMLMNPLAEWGASWVMPFVSMRPVMQTYLKWLVGHPAIVTPAMVDQYLAALRVDGFASAIMEASRAVADYRVPYALLRDAPFPRRVLWGERDPLVPVDHGAQLARELGADFLLLPGVGHCLPEEAADVVLASVGGA